jgi:hypothetical protein
MYLFTEPSRSLAALVEATPVLRMAHQPRRDPSEAKGLLNSQEGFMIGKAIVLGLRFYCHSNAPTKGNVFSAGLFFLVF